MSLEPTPDEIADRYLESRNMVVAQIDGARRSPEPAAGLRLLLER